MQLTSVPEDQVLHRPWIDIISPPYPPNSLQWNAVADIARRGGEFVINGAIVKAVPSRETYSLRYK